MNGLKEKLERVAVLATAGSELERDLALELLRGIYAELKFGAACVAADGAADASSAVEAEGAAYSAAEDCDVAAEPVATEEVAIPTAAEPVSGPVPEPVTERVPELAPEPATELAPEPDLIAELIDELIPEPEPTPIREPVPAPVPDPMTAARRVSPDVIRSLYGADDDDPQALPRTAAPEPLPDPAAEPASVPEPIQEPEAVREPLPEPVSAPEWETVHEPAPEFVSASAPEIAPEPIPEPIPMPVPAPVPTPAPAQTYAQPQPAATIGDTVGAGHTTLGESLRSGERDVATRAAAAERPGLRRSIGLNDRFLMIRDMFGGDAAAFDAAIGRLDAFTDLDDAVIWMRTNFDWSADSPGAAMLVILLERKLGR